MCLFLQLFPFLLIFQNFKITFCEQFLFQLHTVCPPKCIHTLTADGSALKTKCVFINAAFLITYCVYALGGHLVCYKYFLPEKPHLFSLFSINRDDQMAFLVSLSSRHCSLRIVGWTVRQGERGEGHCVITACGGGGLSSVVRHPPPRPRRRVPLRPSAMRGAFLRVSSGRGWPAGLRWRAPLTPSPGSGRWGSHCCP